MMWEVNRQFCFNLYLIFSTQAVKADDSETEVFSSTVDTDSEHNVTVLRHVSCDAQVQTNNDTKEKTVIHDLIVCYLCTNYDSSFTSVIYFPFYPHELNLRKLTNLLTIY